MTSYERYLTTTSTPMNLADFSEQQATELEAAKQHQCESDIRITRQREELTRLSKDRDTTVTQMYRRESYLIAEFRKNADLVKENATLRAQIAERGKDSERLDWLERVGFSTVRNGRGDGPKDDPGVHCWRRIQGGEWGWTAAWIKAEYTNARTAIDAAISTQQ